jgi:tetratricopeptide (TPR) repeat protein
MKLKVIRIFAIGFLVVTSVSIFATFIMWIVGFSYISEYSSVDSIEKDEKFLYEEKIKIYSLKLDSLLEVNPLQAELFADKLHDKFKKEFIFLNYKAHSLCKQKKYHEALVVLKKSRESSYFRYLEDQDLNANNIAACFEILKEYDSAIVYYKKMERNDVLFELGKCYSIIKEKDSALFYYGKKLEQFEKLDNKINYINEIDFLKFKIDSIKKASR